MKQLNWRRIWREFDSRDLPTGSWAGKKCMRLIATLVEAERKCAGEES